MARPSKASPVPQSGTVKKRCQTIGCWNEYLQLRESLKKQGMGAREAVVRAYTDLRIEERWQDYRTRQTQAAILGKQAPLTPGEMKEVYPRYQPPSVTREASVGEQVLSLPEQIQWVKRQLARVRNGGDQPSEFPNADVLYWYQIAVTRPVDFDKIVLKIEAPDKDADDAASRDSEYQFREIERQLEEAVKEVGRQLSEYEKGFSETLDEVLSPGPEGSGVEPAVPA